MYLQRLVLFNNSELIFDHEIDVEEKLGSFKVALMDAIGCMNEEMIKHKIRIIETKQ